MSTSSNGRGGVRSEAEVSETSDRTSAPPSAPESEVRRGAVRVRFEGDGEASVTVHVDGPVVSSLHRRLRENLGERDLEITHLRLFVDGGRRRHTVWVSESDGSPMTRARRDEVQAVVLESVSAHVGATARRVGSDTP